ncbi:MAG: signal peptidase I [Planctomycetia bacterium]|nr:signal peptidase I [Planctomycetia bacterium]
MRRFLEPIITLFVGLLLVGGWLVEPFAVVSGSMSPTVLGPHRTFVCAECGKRNDLAADIAEIPGRVAYCAACRSRGPTIDNLPVVPGDRLLVDRRAFLIRAPRRWEIVAFRLPHEAHLVGVKRVVGLPGETIELRDGKFTADGIALVPPAESLAEAPDYTPPRSYRGPLRWQLGPDEYFVVGDNAELSDDSRLWPEGPGVAAQLIVGKPFAVHYPLRAATWYGIPFNVPDVSAIRYIR